MSGKKRRFGRVRRLSSGRFQARYRGLDGLDRPAPHTFERKQDAELWLSEKELELRRGDWFDPDAGRIPLKEYAETWIAERPGLRPRTRQLYGQLLRRHLSGLHQVDLVDVTAARVRQWRKSRLDAGVGEVTVAKAYRLLSAVMNTALDDGLIRRNPCRIRGAGLERTPRRSPVTLAEVYKIADAIQPRYRALVLLTTYAGLRWGEVIALRRSNVDLVNRTVSVLTAIQEIDGELVEGPPKSEAGSRVIGIPEVLLPELRWHLQCFVESGQDSLLFVGPKGATPRRSNFHPVWRKARKAAGLPDLHFHDLRHTGSHLAAGTAGLTIRDLMERLGHSSMRAALIYQHPTSDRERAIARTLDDLARERHEGESQASDSDGDDEDPPDAAAAPTGT